MPPSTSPNDHAPSASTRPPGPLAACLRQAARALLLGLAAIAVVALSVYGLTALILALASL